MIEQFERRELDFMSKYVLSSNSFINNLNDMNPRDLLMKAFKGQIQID